MAAGLISFRGSDVFVTGADKETRFPVGEAVNRLRDWAQRYDSASGRDDEAALLSIGREMFGWLDASGWASHWAKAPDDRALEIRVDGTGDEQETALLDAPWELLAREDGPLALDALQLFAVFRRIGTAGAVRAPTRGDIRLMFMAAAPEGQTVLDFEGEEAAILEATRGSQRVHLVVEETGALESLGERLTSEEGPFEALHLACHGDILPERGPVLMLETIEGGEAQAGPGELVGKLGPPEKRPPLVVLSACRTAEIGAGKGGRMKASGARRDAGVSAGASPELTASFARQLATMAANVVGWDGSVYDRDATEFAAVFYSELGLQRASVPRAAAVGRRELLRARGGDRSSGRGLHWHLARVYLGPGGGGPLCEEGKPVQVARPAEKAFLDRDRGRVPVAPREAFVGRRRTLQRALRAFRDGPAGVLIHGMGALGKSSLAARLASRTPLRPVLIFERYDALAVFDEIVAALPPQDRASARTGWREAIEADESCFGDALEALLSGPLEAAPILLIVDDLERILEKPKPGAEKTAVNARHRAAVGAILKAFAQAATRSRLLITSRYDFRVPDGKGDPAGRLTRLHLQPMPERDRTKQLRAAERFGGREGAERDPTVTALLARAIAAAGGNPGLQEALTRPALAGEVDAAETALGRIEHFQATGAPPADVRALIEDGTAKDSDNALIAFFGRLAFETYRDALTDEEARQLSAATLFSEGVPIPAAALAAAGQALGVEAPRTAIARLLGLGLFDDWGEIGGHAHAAANALARPLAAPLEDADRPRLARAAFAELEIGWRDAEGRFPADPRGVAAAETALTARAAPEAVEAAVFAGASWLARAETRPKAAFALIAPALEMLPEDHACDPGFLRLGVEVARGLGAAETLEALLSRPARPPGSDAPEDAWAHAALDLRRAERLVQIGRVDDAEPLIAAARRSFEAAGDHRAAAIAAGQIADILEARGEIDEALRIRREDQLPVFDRLGDVRARAVTMGKIADILEARGDLDEALRIRREDELPVYDRLGDVRSRAITMGQIADILHARGDLDEALRIRREDELPVYDRLGDVRSRAITMGQIADILQARGDLDEALRIRKEDQLPVFDRLGDVRARAVTMGKIVDILEARGDLDEALRIRKEDQLPVYDRLGDVRSRAVTMGKIADILQARGETDAALRIRKEDQLPVYDRLGDVRERAVTLQKIGMGLLEGGGLEQGRIQEIHDALAESFAISRRLGAPDGVAFTGFPLAQILAAGGQAGEARAVLEDVETAFAKLDHAEGLDAARRLRALIAHNDGE